MVRFPIVIGTNDYTGRFKFHIEKIKNGEPIYFPNIDAQISFVSEDFAASALYELGFKKVTGPINVASPEPISLQKFMEILQKNLNEKPVITDQPLEENHSPYGIQNDWYMDCEELKKIGIEPEKIDSWLPRLI